MSIYQMTISLLLLLIYLTKIPVFSGKQCGLRNLMTIKWSINRKSLGTIANVNLFWNEGRNGSKVCAIHAVKAFNPLWPAITQISLGNQRSLLYSNNINYGGIGAWIIPYLDSFSIYILISYNWKTKGLRPRKFLLSFSFNYWATLGKSFAHSNIYCVPIKCVSSTLLGSTDNKMKVSSLLSKSSESGEL